VQPVSRRSFLLRGSAAAGVAAVAAGTGVASISGPAGASPLTAEELEALDQPVLVHVRDAAKGEVEVLVGESEIVFTDKPLVAKVLRATR
jgi:hypothetical protein